MTELTRQQKAERIYEFEERAALIEESMPVPDRMVAENMAEKLLGFRPKWGGSIVGVIDAGKDEA